MIINTPKQSMTVLLAVLLLFNYSPLLSKRRSGDHNNRVEPKKPLIKPENIKNTDTKTLEKKVIHRWLKSHRFIPPY